MADETVNLNLGGDFAAKATEGAAAGEKLGAVMGKLEAAASKVKVPELGNAAKDADKLGKAMEKASGSAAKVGAQKYEAPPAKEAESFAGALGKAAPAAAILGAELMAAKAAADLLGKAFEFAVDKSTQKEIQGAILGQLGGDFALPIRLAARFGLDEGKAIEQVKTLLGAKLGKTEVESFVRIAVGVGAVRGEGKAQALMEKIATQAAKGGKASEETIQGFAEAGISSDKVWAKLAAKLGVSIDQAKAKVKTGAVTMQQALDAVRQAGEEDFGKIADKMGSSVPALLNRIRIGFGSMFANVDLQPVKDVLGAVADLLEGDKGKALGAAIKDVFGAGFELIFGTLKDNKDVAGSVMDGLTSGLKKVSAFVKDITPGVRGFIDGFKEGFGKVSPLIGQLSGKLLEVVGSLGGAKGVAEAVGKGFGFVAGAAVLAAEGIGALFGAVTAVLGVGAAITGAIVGALSEALEFVVGFGGKLIATIQGWFGGGASQAQAGGSTVGAAMASGVAEGLASGASAALNAAVQLVTNAIGGAMGAADAHSPSRKMEKLGGWMGEGATGGMEAQNDNAKAAGAGLAESAMAGTAEAAQQGGARGAMARAAGGEQGQGGPGAPDGGGDVNITVQIAAAPGMKESEAKALGDAAGAGAHAGWTRSARRAGRDGREGSRAAA